MADVQFEEPQFGAGRTVVSGKPTAMQGLMIKLGLAKDAKTADRALLVVLGVVVAVTLFLLFTTVLPNASA